jgi:hypothetical protein
MLVLSFNTIKGGDPVAANGCITPHALRSGLHSAVRLTSRAARRKFAALISNLLFPIAGEKKGKRQPNYTTIAKIAHAGINCQGHNKRAGIVRFQRPRPALTVDPATRFWWLSGENGLVCVMTCKAAMFAFIAMSAGMD